MNNAPKNTGSLLPPSPPPVKIFVEKGAAERRVYTFTQPFRAGRDKTCDVWLSDPSVSRFHAEFWFAEGAWWVLDLQSANGTYVNGMKVDRALLARQLGPAVRLWQWSWRRPSSPIPRWRRSFP